MRTVVNATVAAGLALGAPGAALAQEPPRVAKYDDAFGSELPGTSSARRVESDHVNPEDPDGKPHAISHVHVELAPGTVVDTAAVPQCTATDAELMLAGAEACPPESVVGDGLVVFDTGVSGAAREVVSDIVFVNARDQLIFVTTQRGANTHLIVRARYSNGNEIDVDVPPVPGAPPDGAADTYELIELQERSGVKGGRRVAYMTTPPTCPAEGVWTNRLTYTFRDGVEQTYRATTPCRRPAAEPSLRLAGVPGRRCVRRSFRARVAVRSAPGLRTVDVHVDGRRVRRVPQYRFRTDVSVRDLEPGMHRLSVVARTATGRLRRSARFRRC
jgi:hypothetical protein